MASEELRALYQSHVVYLLDRPTEPFFVPKGDQRAIFEVPSNDFLVEKFRPLANELGTRYGDSATVKIPVRSVALPDITYPLELGRYDHFSLFIPRHREMASKLIDLFMGMQTYDDFLSTCVYCRDRVNPYMYVYALSVAILHRPETRGVMLPPLSEIFPDKFFGGGMFSMAREVANLYTDGTRQPLVIPPNFTASDLEDEHRVAYFREDIGVNLHHWHWHLVYPFQGPRSIVDKDRRGELFYYMHQQIMARFNFERLCNNLGRATRLLELREPIPEGYFPKLDNINSSRVWAPRHSGARLRNINRERDQLRFDLQDLERWRDRIIEAIHMGRVINQQGQAVELTEMGGIDILGNIIEASILSVNPNLYGNLHNLGHVVIALAHDPDNRHLETFSVMGDPATAMRDPVFYRWHAFIDDIFQMHKNTLPRYTLAQLGYPGVRMTSLEVVTTGGRTNELDTFWQQEDMDLSRGLDFAPRGPIFVRFTHLQHTSFLYRIQVENTSNAVRVGTVRIFMAPKLDERGQRMLFRDQRHLFIELDKFQVRLKTNPRSNLIERESRSSSVTIPFEKTFRDLEANPSAQPGVQPFNFCGCGWPDHLLIPKGTAEGFQCQLFAMISNIEDDAVDEPNPTVGSDADASSYCGIRDRRYPDRRSMGFPFDRMPRTGVDTIEQFITPNMALTDVHIFFNNHTEPPKAASTRT